MNINHAFQRLPDVSPEQKTSSEMIKLIRKLRWIGLDDEARRLQAALPVPHRDIVLGLPPETD